MTDLKGKISSALPFFVCCFYVGSCLEAAYSDSGFDLNDSRGKEQLTLGEKNVSRKKDMGTAPGTRTTTTTTTTTTNPEDMTHDSSLISARRSENGDYNFDVAMIRGAGEEKGGGGGGGEGGGGEGGG